MNARPGQLDGDILQVIDIQFNWKFWQIVPFFPVTDAISVTGTVG